MGIVNINLSGPLKASKNNLVRKTGRFITKIYIFLAVQKYQNNCLQLKKYLSAAMAEILLKKIKLKLFCLKSFLF